MKKGFRTIQRSLAMFFALMIVLLFGFCKHETKSKVAQTESNDQLSIPGYDLARDYPHAHGAKDGAMVFRVLHEIGRASCRERV